MFDPYPTKAWLTAAQVAEMIGVSDTGLANIREIDPTFPKPRRWSTGGIRFDKFKVMVWAENQPLAGQAPTEEEPEEPPPQPRQQRRRPANQ